MVVPTQPLNLLVWHLILPSQYRALPFPVQASPTAWWLQAHPLIPGVPMQAAPIPIQLHSHLRLLLPTLFRAQPEPVPLTFR